MRRRTRGGSAAALKNWASKALSLVKKYGPGLARQYKLGSRGLAYASKSLPQYSKYIDPIQNFAAQQGYGLRTAGRGLRTAGRGLRTVGRGCYMRKCYRKK